MLCHGPARTRLLQYVFVMASVGACGRFGFEQLQAGPLTDALSPTEDTQLPTDVTQPLYDAVTYGDSAPKEADALAVPESCPNLASTAIALWVFEGVANTLVPDLVAGRNGQWFGDGVIGATAPGACGSSISFPGSGSNYILVPSDPAWELTEGSLDFWLRPGPPGGIRALVSRDRVGSMLPGHFGVFLVSDNRLVVRIQEATSAPSGGTVVGLCSNTPLDPDAWVHVGVNFGPPAAELVINGLPAQFAGMLPNAESTLGNFRCGLNSSQGIAGNLEPWVFGGSYHQSGLSDEVKAFAKFATLGRIRLSPQRRNFHTSGPQDN